MQERAGRLNDAPPKFAMRERLDRRREQRQAVLRMPHDVQIDLAVELA
jgi:hypothetical protein